MINKRLYLVSTFSFLLLLSFAQDRKTAHLAPDKRAKALLSKMTLSEKAAQLKNCSFVVIRRYVSPSGEVNSDSLKKYFPDGVGGINIDINLDPEVYVNVANSIQKYNKTTANAIPAMFIGEGLHGFMSRGATVFPQSIALGCTWDTALLERIYSATALEASSRGVKQILSPVLDLGRDPRFGRIEEMYSEDAYLTAMYGQAAVWGLQGRSGNPDSDHVAATLKHFVGHGIPEGGRNVAPANISQYDLMNEHLLPFEKCIDAGVLSVMPSYNEINGLPNHANKWLLRDLLRRDLKFKGLICADQNAIDEVYQTHHVASSFAEAGKIAIENGIDVDIRYTKGTYDELEKLVKEGKLNEKYIDESVLRLLELKFRLGLFDNGDIDAKRMKQVTNSIEHKQLALEAAEKSLVLLKNNENTLPLDARRIKSVAVIGPMANDLHFGGYTAEPIQGTDVLSGIRKFAGNQFQVGYAEGCKIAKEQPSFWRDDVQTPNDETSDLSLISEAVALAKQSDVVVLAIGESVSFSREAWGENHLGDRESLELLGRQNLLAEALVATGKPIVALIFGGRPLSFNYIAQNMPAVIQVFYPGLEGGTAIANVIFGKVNPSAKLATTIPKSVGQLPCYYSRKPSRMRSYIGYKGSEPLYPFGFGLSYTSFAYSNITLDKLEMASTGALNASVQITNTGKVAGEEIVQLYIRDLVSSGVRPIKELKDFARVALMPGETKTVTFVITPDKLEYYNPALRKVIEPGEFEVMIGPSSVDVKKAVFKVR